MTVAFDARTANGNSTGNFSFTHTPVGTPRGVLVLVAQASVTTDEVTDVTYGGVACTEVSGSPVAVTSSESGASYAYFLGSSIPTGAQTVSVTTTGTTGTRRVVVITITAAADTEVVDVFAFGSTGAQPIGTVYLSSRDSFVAQGLWSSVNNITSLNPPSGWAQLSESNIVSGQIVGFNLYNTISNVDVQVNRGDSSSAAFATHAVGISEVVAGAASFAFRRAFPRAILNF